MNKIRVIDLLNKIANGEDVPEKIKINNIIYEYRGDDYLFKDTNNDNHEYWLFSNGYTDKFEWLDSFLKTEVEIIEEDKKLKKIKIEYSPDIEEKIFYEDGDKPNHCILGDTGTGLLINKINELIDKVNNMENN
jgi:hypothetical protein